MLDYWLQRESLDDVKNRLQQMELTKYKAVQEMLAVIETSDCLREKVVAYFGQTINNKPGNCCTNCGVDLSQLVFERTQAEVEHQKITWQSRLQQLLFPNL